LKPTEIRKRETTGKEKTALMFLRHFNETHYPTQTPIQ
jgi:hypothetical protein